jgi:hypothetical protein
MAEKSGVHLTGADSGWPVGGTSEPGAKKDGTGSDPHSRAASVAGNTFEVNERQQIVVDATGGTYKLKFEGQTTTALSALATATDVQNALIALSNIGVGDVAVTGGPGSAGGKSPYYVTFQGALKEKDVAAIEVVEEVTTGGAGTVTVTTTTGGS